MLQEPAAHAAVADEAWTGPGATMAKPTTSIKEAPGEH